VELGLFQASELELMGRIAILTRIPHVQAVIKRVIFRNSAASAKEIRVYIAMRLEIDQIRLFFEQEKIPCNIRIFSNL